MDQRRIPDVLLPLRKISIVHPEASYLTYGLSNPCYLHGSGLVEVRLAGRTTMRKANRATFAADALRCTDRAEQASQEFTFLVS
jgi:hypothetical protein